MKTTLFSLLLTMASFSLTSHALSPVLVDEDILIQLNTGGGMPVPGGIRFREITVRKTGEVKMLQANYSENSEDIFDNETVVESVLGVVAPADLAAIESAVAQIKGGKLVKSRGPECMDAPSFNYQVAKDGILITVVANHSCRDYQLADKKQRKAAARIKTYLDAWSALTYR